MLRECCSRWTSADHHQLIFINKGCLVNCSCAHLVLLYLHVSVGRVCPCTILDLFKRRCLVQSFVLSALASFVIYASQRRNATRVAMEHTAHHVSAIRVNALMSLAFSTGLDHSDHFIASLTLYLHAASLVARALVVTSVCLRLLIIDLAWVGWV